MLFLLTFLFGLTLSYNLHDYNFFFRRQMAKLDVSETFYMPLSNHEINATKVTETKYPWVAKVVHSITSDVVPYVCTASCIQERVFITAARCLYMIKVAYTSLIYQKNHQLLVETFILPSNPTKQSYDDIGFIVVKKPKESVDWKHIELLNDVTRTDATYQWFLKLPQTGYTAVGYATMKDLSTIYSTKSPYNLTELNVVIGLDICWKILTENQIAFDGFHVPCFCACTVDEYLDKDPKCSSFYHGVEGAAVIETKSNKLLGVATWGQIMYKFVLPVGLSVANSENFYKDYECAKAIVKDESLAHTDGLHYQKLCDEL